MYIGYFPLTTAARERTEPVWGILAVYFVGPLYITSVTVPSVIKTLPASFHLIF